MPCGCRPRPRPGMVAWMTVDCLVLTLLVAPTGCYAGAVPSTTIDVNTDVAVHVLVVDSHFLSFTLDAIELTNGFNGSSLTSTVLLKCTQALTSAYLRIGGSTEDFLRYSFGHAVLFSRPARARTLRSSCLLPHSTSFVPRFRRLPLYLQACCFERHPSSR